MHYAREVKDKTKRKQNTSGRGNPGRSLMHYRKTVKDETKQRRNTLGKVIREEANPQLRKGQRRNEQKRNTVGNVIRKPHVLQKIREKYEQNSIEIPSEK
jgi:hypothetical protein